MSKARNAATAAVLTALLATAACSLAPPYQPPATVAPPAYKEVAGWTAAAPADATPRGAWWSMFADPVLDDLETRAEQASPTLAAALARYDAARALVSLTASDQIPTVVANTSAGRTRASAGRPLSNGSAVTYNAFSIGATLDYELDLWGRVRNSVRADRADAAASQADLAAVRLSLQASVADAYFRLRGLDAQAALLHETVLAYERARDLTTTRHDGGIASGLDVSRADNILSAARAQISATANERAATEHEIAALTGAVASSFAIAPLVRPLEPPPVAFGVPSQLVERRPDVAKAERRIAAANFRIGVARAAYFPNISLGLGGGVEATSGSIFSSGAGFWALGPAQALLTLFDGGRRRAQVRISRAQYDEAAANYRSTVLTAFREAEDQIAATRHLTAQAADQLAAAQAAERTRELALVRYRDGASDYLDVVTAQTASLEAERAALAVQTSRMQTAVSLVRALGGSYVPAA
ncbi:efflux transporter outer membrane subunit [Polymorphobacter sp. PAMC 29334]|uniref:efflux transporter outer membrane subunit n=1 Tax=Polymorphobacter sp. PAMC 29334 TaxID=2862331 RepID=UPI001C782FFA|nr:efflux transporter outer membrane subunit [Polymorphobacter sp. PAMC 29334]QYE35779.1 efflux transporter outer membrane subunit [Polymorphobacter sp. PAMC 29334]